LLAVRGITLMPFAGKMVHHYLLKSTPNIPDLSLFLFNKYFTLYLHCLTLFEKNVFTVTSNNYKKKKRRWHKPATWGFMQVGLDKLSFSKLQSRALVRAAHTSLGISS
jgi:hypothetical protein